MRPRACIGGLLLALGACAHLPERVTINVDGRGIELRQQGLSTVLQSGQWSTALDCAADAPLIDSAVTANKMVLVGPDHLQILLRGGRVLSLYRCDP